MTASFQITRRAADRLVELDVDQSAASPHRLLPHGTGPFVQRLSLTATERP